MNNFVLYKKEKFYCFYCEAKFDTRDLAEEHVDKHELILVPIAKKDIGRLNQFFFLKDDKLIPQELLKVIQRYARNITRNG